MEYITYLKPQETLFKSNPNLYLAQLWAIRFKKINMDYLYYEDLITHNQIQEKRKLADRVLMNACHLVDNKKQMDINRWHCRNKRRNLGRLTEDQEWAFSYDYFSLIDRVCDKILIIDTNN